MKLEVEPFVLERARIYHERGTLQWCVLIMTLFIGVEIAVLVWITQQEHIWSAPDIYGTQTLDVKWGKS